MRVVSNTRPLIGLFNIRKLEILQEVFGWSLTSYPPGETDQLV